MRVIGEMGIDKVSVNRCIKTYVFLGVHVMYLDVMHINIYVCMYTSTVLTITKVTITAMSDRVSIVREHTNT